MENTYDLYEKLKDILRSFHNSSCYPTAMDYEYEESIDDIMQIILDSSYDSSILEQANRYCYMKSGVSF